MDSALLIFVLTIVGMMLFAVFLTIGCVRGIRAEQEEARQQKSECCCPCHKS